MKTTRSFFTLVVTGTLLLSVGRADAKVYKTQKQVLAEVFPGGFQRQTVFLNEDQVRAIEKRARAKVESKIITYYVGRSDDQTPAGTIFFDTHTVRSMPETILVWLQPDSRIRSVEILAFYEPEDYKVRSGWLKRLDGKGGEAELVVGRDLDQVTGATLTVRALAQATRRILAIHAIVLGEAE
jgi:Na+-translocating ferredoxin:NAD+ oxidoreductase RnfG subunit